ncbi:UNVERIFIED_CONTAM: hypothetical protein Sangu_2466200 [Sesamum angustifolium]|uniref:Rubisco LSMT substrate-binding domain-containing protein n=1 Tax=Sesamum angustifolium TaxID=2727405 RepID=A0AAW2J4D8_9LAMI
MEVDEHAIDDGVTLVLDLAETDPFYEKKKKLLKDMGFDLESSVCIKSSSTPDQLKDVLDLLLRQARIINFNEVELYFDGDIINLGNWVSPRNELEALHSILEVISKSLSSAKYTIKNVEGAGRGAIANEDLKVGDIALEIPVSVIICEDVLHESDMFPIFEKVDGISEETMLLLWSMKEKHNNNSKFKLYFDTLPEQFDTGLSFGIDAVMALDGTLLLEEIVQAKEHLRAQYDELFPALSDHNPEVFPPELYTWEQFLWACELWYSNSMKICPHIMHYGRIDASTNSLKFPLSRPCHSGEQCFLSYGNFSSSHLLTFYGFLPQGDNPYDVIPLDIDVVRDEDPEVGPAPCEWSSHMVRGTWLSKNHEIFHYGLPHPLLDHLRRARNSALQSSTLTRELLQTDLDVLRDLSSTFEAMLENLGDEKIDNGEQTSWDVKLATEFRNLQRRIVSSISTSCNTGCELLESEFAKEDRLLNLNHHHDWLT